ncbi:Tyrosine recombinase XerC [Porphyromonas levii]|uniref:site-specific integrase n=1 Tax=Porphyromonas levii TaxID=28114 RepID=UPI001B8C3C97|nr:site-specific integrase [Porphyromonas levii]MBR8731406.1 Tyrosine recombinase XerC [Porphyromonas levii]MBR8759810.1 Tyrosine recombinase XerC [Porphyromonas levii]
MRSTFRTLFYINRSKAKADGMTAILCRITIDGKQTTITTCEECLVCDWNSKRGETKDKRTNERLQEFKARIESCYAELLQRNGVVSAELVKSHLISQETTQATLLKASRAEVEAVKACVGKSIGKSTYQGTTRKDQILREFVAEQIGEGKDILLSTIREELFEEYCFYLKKRRLVSATINQHLCWLSRLMYRAVGQGIIRSNPFEDAKYEAVERKLRYLHKGEVDQLLKFPMNDKIAEEARRMFLFSCFTGLSFSDMQALTKANFGITADGEHYIRKERKKTGVESLIPLHPIAKEIALKQANEEESKLFSESYKYHQLKEALKAVGQACGIRQTLTFHMARHTFGTMALSAGVPMESIAKMMGHTTIKSTQIYAQVTDQKISEDMDKLIAKREEGKQ